MKKNKRKIVIVSGYFNPVHMGHINMFNEAREMGDFLFVIVNNDQQVKIKGSVPFMDAHERAKIISHFRAVNASCVAIDKDITVCQTLEYAAKVVYSDCDIIFANGGDRKNTKDIPEAKLCKKLGIKMVFNVGGKKIQSSSKLINKAKKYAK